ncbi:hypothetical protein PGT21_017492 [Puccinia graminis f. sp. tritici]|uniref:SLC41A/MgtE integral membrane domain-containing protein n=1 Tax=Puccinia graminis f. sp. tritici TaxID=56615 RepID=A0A5B0M5C3_PUCGR|nr:hypothetical protein PGT21_017492 [Puccinia graminis f. sp. tritici]KAA1125937.1 hypothetical protein PGTUg99_022829 [Puccinia graminis f. sp. tritici]
MRRHSHSQDNLPPPPPTLNQEQQQQHQQHHISFSSTHRRSSSASTTTNSIDSLKTNNKPITLGVHSPLLQSDQEEEEEEEEKEEEEEEDSLYVRRTRSSEAHRPRPPARKHHHHLATVPVFSVTTLVLQTLPSLILSVLGGCLTGLLLHHVQDWDAFTRVPELYILLPVLMNLKGNLEMNLAARLSTSANMGDLDTPKGRRSLVAGNLTLLQVQALLVSFVASLVSFVLGLMSREDLATIRGLTHAKPLGSLVQSTLAAHWNSPLHRPDGGYAECLLVLAAGMLAASVNSLLLGALVSGLVIACRILKINPDNITTPIASSLGDLMTLVFLSLAASVFIRYVDTAISTVIFVALACSVGMHGYATLRNEYVQGYLGVGWTPLFVAMAISTCSGLLLEKVVVRLDGFAAVAPVLTGICGNIGTISVSRISTALHAARNASSIPPPFDPPSLELKPHNGFRKLHHNDDDHHQLDLELDDELNDDDEDQDDQDRSPSHVFHEPARKVGIVLLVLSSLILGAFGLIHMGRGSPESGFDFSFFIGFMICVIWTSVISLVAAYHLTHLLWKFNLDPDIYAIPLLSSSIDLVGQASLVLAFFLFKH